VHNKEDRILQTVGSYIGWRERRRLALSWESIHPSQKRRGEFWLRTTSAGQTSQGKERSQFWGRGDGEQGGGGGQGGKV